MEETGQNDVTKRRKTMMKTKSKTTVIPPEAETLDAGPFAVLKITKRPGCLTVFETGIKVAGPFDLKIPCTRYGNKSRRDADKSVAWLKSLIDKYPQAWTPKTDSNNTNFQQEAHKAK